MMCEFCGNDEGANVVLWGRPCCYDCKQQSDIYDAERGYTDQEAYNSKWSR